MLYYTGKQIWGEARWKCISLARRLWGGEIIRAKYEMGPSRKMSFFSRSFFFFVFPLGISRRRLTDWLTDWCGGNLLTLQVKNKISANLSASFFEKKGQLLFWIAKPLLAKGKNPENQPSTFQEEVESCWGGGEKEKYCYKTKVG